MARTGTSSVEDFVRSTLGCHCPDEVFESIVIEPLGTAGADGTRVVVGHRLLIYVLRCADGPEAAATVTRCAAVGIAERDARQFNRFRLVVAWPRPAPVAADAELAFAHVARDDERAHLHVVGVDQLPDALRSHRPD